MPTRSFDSVTAYLKIKQKVPNIALIGSADLYAQVRAGFVAQGTSFNKWCADNGVYRDMARRAICGEATTASALALVNRIIEAALPQAVARRA